MVWHCEDCSLFKDLNIIFSFLSLVGSIWMSIFCLSTHKMKSVLYQFIFSIAITDVIFSIVNFLSLAQSSDPEPVEPVCKIEAILRFWCWRLSIVFPAAIAILCYKDTSEEGAENFDQNKFFKMNLLIFSIIFLIMSLLPFVFPDQIAFTNGDVYCYINYNTLNPKLSNTMKLIILTIYEGIFDILGVAISLVAYIHTANKMKELPREERRLMKIKPNRLFWYPGILLLVYVPALLDKYYRIYNSKSNVWMIAIHLSISRFVGVYNALVYGLQRRNHQKVYDSHLSKVSNDIIKPIITPPNKSVTSSVDEALFRELNR